MSGNIYLSLLVIALTIYAIRLLPFLFLRKNITNVFIRTFLFYVPYVTLAVMTFPAILGATDSVWSGLAALAVAVVVALCGGSLFSVAIAACAAVYVVELIIL
ncbi:MAG: AzlD domain-containing protein [Lachnospiraceae bacterium]|jgi:branched-subunit amino acid transport protein|nr:AzlD domain-containing protein [Lachnospiraceae bacterium]